MNRRSCAVTEQSSLSGGLGRALSRFGHDALKVREAEGAKRERLIWLRLRAASPCQRAPTHGLGSLGDAQDADCDGAGNEIVGSYQLVDVALKVHHCGTRLVAGIG